MSGMVDEKSRKVGRGKENMNEIFVRRQSFARKSVTTTISEQEFVDMFFLLITWSLHNSMISDLSDIKRIFSFLTHFH